MLLVVIAIAGPDGDCQVVNEEECAATDSSRILEYEHCYSGKTETDKVPENPGGTSKNTVSRGSCARVYRSTWEKEFPWLSTSENQKLFCSLCRLAKMKNAFATTGACTYAVYFSDTHVCFAALQFICACKLYGQNYDIRSLMTAGALGNGWELVQSFERHLLPSLRQPSSKLLWPLFNNQPCKQAHTGAQIHSVVHIPKVSLFSPVP